MSQLEVDLLMEPHLTIAALEDHIEDASEYDRTTVQLLLNLIRLLNARVNDQMVDINVLRDRVGR
jgi:hypothetical protein